MGAMFIRGVEKWIHPSVAYLGDDGNTLLTPFNSIGVPLMVNTEKCKICVSWAQIVFSVQFSAVLDLGVPHFLSYWHFMVKYGRPSCSEKIVL